MRLAFRTIMLLGLTPLLGSCGVKRLERKSVEPARAATLDQKSPYLNAHLKSGHVYVLAGWSFDSAQQIVTGRGDLLDWNRRIVATGTFRLPIDSVALFETNVVGRSGSMAAVTVMAGITAAEENPRLAARMLIDPAGMLKTLAPAYKRQEPTMESLFWNSRYVRH